ncbi:hypothetical protein K474DRAFT_1665748 [Panus rudis PR-1116 ss-1]|nr:hypothetical protein K474DRAFT_1665748 [Panus rudis PR-1116 ss-1]
MSKTAKKPAERPSRKVTDFFQKTSSFSSPSSLSSVTSSQKSASSSKCSQSEQRGSKTVGEPVVQSSTTKSTSRAAASSVHPPLTPIPLSDTHLNSCKPSGKGSDHSATRKTTAMKAPAEVVDLTSTTTPIKPQGFKPRTVVTSAAKTSVRKRVPLPPPSSKSQKSMSVMQMAKSRLSVKRKFHPDSDEPSPPSEVVYITPQASDSSSSLSPLSSSSSSEDTPARPLKLSIPETRKAHNSIPQTPSKKVRLSPCTPSRRSARLNKDVEELVPTSQSDERELIPLRTPKKDAKVVLESVSRWRRDTLSVGPPDTLGRVPSPDSGVDAPMQIDNDGDLLMLDDSEPRPPFESGTLTPLSESEEVDMHPPASSPPSSPPKTPDVDMVDVDPFKVPSRPHTPERDPAENLVPMPKTPVALTGESKAAKIIEEIKAKAAAQAAQQASSSDDDPVQQLKLSDIESSDDELPERPLDFVSKGKAKALETPAISSTQKAKAARGSLLTQTLRESSPESPVGRYNLRRHSPTPKAGPSTIVPQPARKPKKSANPIDKLLKEKKLADKRGMGLEALKNAEAAVDTPMEPTQSRAELMKEMEDEEDGDDEEDVGLSFGGASGSRIASGSSRATSLGKVDGNESDNENVFDIEEDQCRKILGDKGGAAVGKILAQDRNAASAGQTSARKPKALRGVPLWNASQDGDVSMEVDVLPALSLSDADIEGDRLLSLFRTAIISNDKMQQSMLLRPEMIRGMKAKSRSLLFPWICEQAFSSDSALSYLALNVLKQIPVTFPAESVQFSVVSSALIRLGASLNALSALGWTIPAGVSAANIDSESRESSLVHLVSFISVYAQQRLLPSRDLVDYVVALLLIGLDPTTSRELLRDIKGAIENVVSCLQSMQEEEQLCAKIYSFAKDFEPINKALTLSFFIRASDRSARMARWMARLFLLGPDHPSLGPYQDLPSMKPYISLISPHVHSKELFDVLGNQHEPGYYGELQSYFEVLDVALTGIGEYVYREALEGKSVPRNLTDSPKKDHERSDVDTLKQLLDLMHGRIVDTRAAYLERSRVKATIQRVAFRIYYQLQDYRRHGRRTTGAGKPKPRTLHGYFAAPS